MACCSTIFLHVLFHIFNTILCSLGLVAIGLGIRTIVDDWEWDNLIKDNPETKAAYITIASGIIVIIIGIIGCCGAIRGNARLLIVYAILVSTIFLVKLAGGIYIGIRKEDIVESLEAGIEKVIKKTYGEIGVFTKAIDIFQKHARCCGVEKPEDWSTSNWYKRHDAPRLFPVPKSCCVQEGDEICNKGPVSLLKSKKSIYTKGCLSVIRDFISKHVWILGGATIGIMADEVFLIICAFLLWRSNKGSRSSDFLMNLMS